MKGKFKPGDILVLRSSNSDAKIWCDVNLNSVDFIGSLRENQYATVISSYSNDNLVVYIIAPEGIGWIYGSNVQLVK